MKLNERRYFKINFICDKENHGGWEIQNPISQLRRAMFQNNRILSYTAVKTL